MPEAYTHIRIARAITVDCGIKPEHQNAYEMGANGPDPIYCGGIFPYKSKINMQKLGSRMHAEKCGIFLYALLYAAKTAVQRSYAMGFLTHYAADSTMHPYVAAQITQGGQYIKPGGHMYCESAIDSYYYLKDKGDICVPQCDTSPDLTAKEVAEICVLMKKCIKFVYNEDLSMAELSDAYQAFRIGHVINVSRFGFKKLFAHALENGMKIKGELVGRMSPCKPPKEGFMSEWVNPHTGEKMSAGPNALCMIAVNDGSKYIKTAFDMWRGALSHREAMSIIGNKTYSTGLPCTDEKKSEEPQESTVQEATPQEATEPQSRPQEAVEQKNTPQETTEPQSRPQETVEQEPTAAQ